MLKHPVLNPRVLFISTSERMLAHAFTWSKTMKNAWKLSKEYFFRNCWGATSFWVSTSVLESLLSAKKLHFSLCSCMSLTWVSREYDKKALFKYFWVFFIVFDHVNACASMRQLVKIHNKHVYYAVQILSVKFCHTNLVASCLDCDRSCKEKMRIPYLSRRAYP